MWCSVTVTLAPKCMNEMYLEESEKEGTDEISDIDRWKTNRSMYCTSKCYVSCYMLWKSQKMKHLNVNVMSCNCLLEWISMRRRNMDNTAGQCNVK